MRCDGRHPLASARRAMAITMCHATAMPVAWFAMADSPSRISVALGIGPLCHAACEERSPCAAASASARRLRPSSMRRVMRNAAGSITRMNSQDPRVRGTRTRLRDTSRVRRLVERVQAELPDPCEAVACATQDERPIWLDRRDRKSLTASNGDLVTDGQLLKLRQDGVCAWAIEIPEQTVQPVVAV